MDANTAFVQAMRTEFPELTIMDVTASFHGESMTRWGNECRTRDKVVLMVFRTPQNEKDVLQHLRTHIGAGDQTSFTDWRWVCMHGSVLLPCGPMPTSGADLRLVSSSLKGEGIKDECPICLEQYTPYGAASGPNPNQHQTQRPAVRLSSDPQCLHVFCGPCAQKMLKEKFKSLKQPVARRLDHIMVTCPLCRQQHKLNNTAGTGSPPEFLLQPASPIQHMPNSKMML